MVLGFRVKGLGPKVIPTTRRQLVPNSVSLHQEYIGGK